MKSYSTEYVRHIDGIKRHELLFSNLDICNKVSKVLANHYDAMIIYMPSIFTKQFLWIAREGFMYYNNGCCYKEDQLMKHVECNDETFNKFYQKEILITLNENPIIYCCLIRCFTSNSLSKYSKYDLFL